jgi:hypothetical protein
MELTSRRPAPPNAQPAGTPQGFEFKLTPPTGKDLREFLELIWPPSGRLSGGLSSCLRKYLIDLPVRRERTLVARLLMGLWETRASAGRPSGRRKDADHYRHLALAYSFSNLLDQYPKKAMVVSALCRHLGVKDSKHESQCLFISLRIFIGYKKYHVGKATRIDQYWDRDACAIEFLKSKGISPDNMLSAINKKGENITRWSTEGRIRRAHLRGELPNQLSSTDLSAIRKLNAQLRECAGGVIFINTRENESIFSNLRIVTSNNSDHLHRLWKHIINYSEKYSFSFPNRDKREASRPKEISAEKTPGESTIPQPTSKSIRNRQTSILQKHNANKIRQEEDW